MNTGIDFLTLKQLTGYERPGDVKKCLERQGIPVLNGKEGPFTTLDALNIALGLKTGVKPVNDPMEF